MQGRNGWMSSTHQLQRNNGRRRFSAERLGTRHRNEGRCPDLLFRQSGGVRVRIYYLHLHYGSFKAGSTGEPFPDDGAAKAHAQMVAAELARNSSKRSASPSLTSTITNSLM